MVKKGHSNDNNKVQKLVLPIEVANFLSKRPLNSSGSRISNKEDLGRVCKFGLLKRPLISSCKSFSGALQKSFNLQN